MYHCCRVCRLQCYLSVFTSKTCFTLKFTAHREANNSCNETIRMHCCPVRLTAATVPCSLTPVAVRAHYSCSLGLPLLPHRSYYLPLSLYLSLPLRLSHFSESQRRDPRGRRFCPARHDLSLSRYRNPTYFPRNIVPDHAESSPRHISDRGRRYLAAVSEGNRAYNEAQSVWV